jgi:two-component system OmpR family sensor kinase
MTAKAAEIDAGRLDERIDVPGPADDLGRLAVTLNTMLDRVQTGFESKRRFIADASHELRTPLAIMRSELDVSLRDPGLDPGAREVLSSARDEVERMSVTVENLLMLARLDEGGDEMALSDVDLAASARGAVDAMRPLADARSVRLSSAGVTAIVRADDERIARVLSNLLANAIAYSPVGGEIDVTSWRRDGEAGVSVRDHGPGIPAAMLSTIFDRFVRTDGARASDTGGSGLGLAIAKEIVEAHGGRIWAESREGAGATFSFAVPTG